MLFTNVVDKLAVVFASFVHVRFDGTAIEASVVRAGAGRYRAAFDSIVFRRRRARR